MTHHLRAWQDDGACETDRLEAFLQDSLGPDEEAELLLHLDACLSCRSRLDQRAAEPETWTDASQFLQDELYDEFSVSHVDIEEGPPSDSPSAQIRSVLDTLDPTDDPASLGRLGAYEVTGVIGSGGMGVVLKGLDRSLDRIIAIKVLAPHLASSGAARQRFAREAKAAAAVLHPNVIAIHGVSNNASLPYLVMPYIRGESLQRRLDQEGPLGIVDVLRIGVQVASGLAAAHSQGLVHRDIKPANILLEDGVERVTITDFGLARAVDDASMTRSGVIAGTPQYMSPEQARGEPIDARSDLFSLGSAIYAMCTGHLPFRAETSYGVLRRITDDSPRPIREINTEIPEWMCRLIAGLHAKEPDQRYGSAESVERVLRQCISHVEQPDVNPIPQQLLLAPTAATRWAKYAAGFALAVLVCALAVLLTRHPQVQRDAAATHAVLQEGSDLQAPAQPPGDASHWDETARWDDEMNTEIQTAVESLQTIRDSSNRFFDPGPHRRVQQDTSPTLPIQESSLEKTKP
jgi:serine/threonine protein kinase